MANISKEAREDRKKKEAKEILKRIDEEYLEIEAFKEYEFSWCIAFEMAKRDPDLVKDVQRFIKYYNRWKSYIDFIPFSLKSFEENFEYRVHRRAKTVFEYWYDYLAQKYWLAPTDLFYITMNKTALEMAEAYVHQFHDIQDRMPNERFTRENKEGLFFKSSVNLNNVHFFQDKGAVSDEEILEAIQEFDIDPSMIESQIKVMENFTRPKLSIPATVNKSVHIELNLALPEKELVAYISTIKEKYDKDKHIIKSAVELLGAELSDAGFLSSDSDQMYKKDRRKTMPEKCADLFFIYDCNMNNLSMDYTLDHLNLYWNEERNAFPEQFQIKTYKRYLKLAKDFIQNRKYQSLLVGQ